MLPKRRSIEGTRLLPTTRPSAASCKLANKSHSTTKCRQSHVTVRIFMERNLRAGHLFDMHYCKRKVRRAGRGREMLLVTHQYQDRELRS